MRAKPGYISLLHEQLRSHVLQGSHKGPGQAGDAQLLGVAQVYQLVDQAALALLHHDVLRLEVPVDDPPVVEVAQGGHDVVQDLQHLGLTEAPAGLDVVQQPPGSSVQQCRDQCFYLLLFVIILETLLR